LVRCNVLGNAAHRRNIRTERILSFLHNESPKRELQCPTISVGITTGATGGDGGPEWLNNGCCLIGRGSIHIAVALVSTRMTLGTVRHGKQALRACYWNMTRKPPCLDDDRYGERWRLDGRRQMGQGGTEAEMEMRHLDIGCYFYFLVLFLYFIPLCFDSVRILVFVFLFLFLSVLIILITILYHI